MKTQRLELAAGHGYFLCTRPPLNGPDFKVQGVLETQLRRALSYLQICSLSVCFQGRKKPDLLGEICPRERLSAKRRSVDLLFKHACLMDISLRAAGGKPSTGDWDDTQDLACFYAKELLNTKNLATAWQLLRYCRTHVTCKLRSVNVGIGFKIRGHQQMVQLQPGLGPSAVFRAPGKSGSLGVWSSVLWELEAA